MKKFIKFLVVPALVLSLLMSACLIAPISVSAEEIENFTFNNPLAVSVSDGNITEGYDIKMTGANLARYDEKINGKNGVIFKLDATAKCYISFGDSKEGTPTYKPSGNWLAAILVPKKEENKLIVRPYTNSGELSAYGTTIENFDFSVPHVYRIVENTSAYRLYVDDVQITHCAVAKTSQSYSIFTEIYNNGGYVTVGATDGATYEGFKINDVSWYKKNSSVSINSGTINSAGALRLEKRIDIAKGVAFKINTMSTGVNINFYQNNDYTGWAKKSTLSFLLSGTPDSETGKGKVTVKAYSSSVNAVIGYVEDFDFNAIHTFSFKPIGDYYYLHIDDAKVTGGTVNYTIGAGEIDLANNYGTGGYFGIGGNNNASASITDFKYYEPEKGWVSNPNTSTHIGADTSVVANEKGGTDISITSSARYNTPLDMTKGVIFKLSTADNAAYISLKKNPTAVGRENSVTDQVNIVFKIRDDGIYTNLWSASGTEANAGSGTVPAEKSGYFHIKMIGNGLYINGQRVIPNADLSSIADQKLYVSFQAAGNNGINITDFKKYSEPDVITGHSVDEKIIYGIDAGTDISDLVVAAKTGDIRFYDGETVVTEGMVKTGMTVCDFLNTNMMSEKYIISVLGDIDGDGDIKATDITLLRKHLLQTEVIEDAAKVKAANVNNAGEIDIKDLVSVKKKSAEISTGKFNVRNYGAVGDGVTDDTEAINNTIKAAVKYSENYDTAAEVVFNNTSYSVQGKINVSNTENLTLSGNNATIIGNPTAEYVTIQRNSNLKIKELNFTYDTPVACRAKVIDRDYVSITEGLNKKRIITLEVPVWYAECVENNTLPSNAFAIPANGGRDIAEIESIELLTDTTCKVTFKNVEGGANGWYILRNELELATESDERCTNYIDMPTPGYSHTGQIFGIRLNAGTVELENCNIWNAANFVFQVNSNLGEVIFNNVNLTPESSDACPTVAWRDVVHAKDNRGALTFNNCNFSGTHDDLLNISATMCEVKEVAQEGTLLTLYGLDYAGGSFATINVGDTLVAFNPTTDKYYGKAKVTAVDRTSGIKVTLDSDIGIEVGAYVYFEELAAPGTVINGGSFSGTLRIRASGTQINNADISLITMWTAYEGPNGAVEGPIPENITYRNCSFSAAEGTAKGAKMNFTCKLLDGSTATSYSVKNILFDNCEFEYESLVPNVDGVIVNNPTISK